jgi:predicted phosphodiesterase
MKLQVASDLHLEFLARFPGERLVSPDPNADLLLLPGDIANGFSAIKLFADWPVPVLYVAGNHEYYGNSWEQTRDDLKRAAQGTQVIFLDNNVADFSSFEPWRAAHAQGLSRLRFLGCTLWTDYCLNTRPKTEPNSVQDLNPSLDEVTGRAKAMRDAELGLNDHNAIRSQQGRFTAAQALADHEQSRSWLKRELAKPFEGKTVVITHHAPHPRSVHPRYLAPGMAHLNPCFASDLSGLLTGADLWLHGHVHDSFDYTVGACRVVANPAGYTGNRWTAHTGADLEFENPLFDRGLVIDV